MKTYILTGALVATPVVGGFPLWDSRLRKLITPPMPSNEDACETNEAPYISVSCPGFQTIISYEIFQKHFNTMSGKRFSECYSADDWDLLYYRVRPARFPKEMKASVVCSQDNHPSYVYANYERHGKPQPTLKLDLHAFHALFTEAK